MPLKKKKKKKALKNVVCFSYEQASEHLAILLFAKHLYLNVRGKYGQEEALTAWFFFF